MKKTSLRKEKTFKNAAVLLAVTVLLTGCGSMSTDSGSIKTAASNSSVGDYYENAAYGEEGAVFEAANEDWDYESGEDAKTVTDAAAQSVSVMKKNGLFPPKSRCSTVSSRRTRSGRTAGIVTVSCSSRTG